MQSAICNLQFFWVTASRSIRLRDSSDLKRAIEGVLQLMFEDYHQVSVASSATLSRARRKVDLAMMIHRRQEWVDTGISNSSIQLSCSAHLIYVNISLVDMDLYCHGHGMAN